MVVKPSEVKGSKMPVEVPERAIHAEHQFCDIFRTYLDAISMFEKGD